MAELYFVNENGQVEINFESLELIVEKIAVDRLKSYIAGGYRVVKITDRVNGCFKIHLYKSGLFIIASFIDQKGYFVHMNGLEIEDIYNIWRSQP